MGNAAGTTEVARWRNEEHRCRNDCAAIPRWRDDSPVVFLLNHRWRDETRVLMAGPTYIYFSHGKFHRRPRESDCGPR